ncbi:hypothetical protein BX600DRAFT_441638 [Xylariales sp. PMI_506]|nr:hypothetical protein BX600DRAFT_441638 [Xylariales sp. PMI_506]
MKSFFVSAALITSALAAPSSLFQVSPRQTCDQSQQPSTQAVEGAIIQWLSDVNEVNNFVDVAVPNNQLLDLARGALTSASDEPTELGILAAICGQNDDYYAAVDTLQAKFPGVPAAVQSIIDNPSPDNLAQQLDIIDQLRCCFVLPSLDTLWSEAAESYGIFGLVDTNVPRPNACSSVSC